MKLLALTLFAMSSWGGAQPAASDGGKSAEEYCTISNDISEVYALKEQSIFLMSFGEINIWASEMMVRCEPQDGSNTLTCINEGKGALVIEEPDQAIKSITVHVDAPGELNIGPGGDRGCASKAELDKYR